MIALIFMSSKDNDAERVMHSKSVKLEMMINYKGDEVIAEPFQTSLSRYQIDLETLMKGSKTRKLLQSSKRV